MNLHKSALVHARQNHARKYAGIAFGLVKPARMHSSVCAYANIYARPGRRMRKEHMAGPEGVGPAAFEQFKLAYPLTEFDATQFGLVNCLPSLGTSTWPSARAVMDHKTTAKTGPETVWGH